MYTYHLSYFISIGCSLLFVVVKAKMDADSTQEVSYEKVKSLENNQSVVLIDVREPQELQATGVIPGSINIPLGKLKNTLENTSKKDFKDAYKRNKPDFETPIVFSCRSGRRSLVAIETAQELGYKKVQHFPGGWLEWEEKSNN